MTAYCLAGRPIVRHDGPHKLQYRPQGCHLLGADGAPNARHARHTGAAVLPQVTGERYKTIIISRPSPNWEVEYVGQVINNHRCSDVGIHSSPEAWFIRPIGDGVTFVRNAANTTEEDKYWLVTVTGCVKISPVVFAQRGEDVVEAELLGRVLCGVEQGMCARSGAGPARQRGQCVRPRAQHAGRARHQGRTDKLQKGHTSRCTSGITMKECVHYNSIACYYSFLKRQTSSYQKPVVLVVV